MKSFLILFSIALSGSPAAVLSQSTDSIYVDNIQTVRLYKQGDQLTFPSIKLNTTDKLELHFDDLDTRVKNYYYTFLLCDYDWTPSTVMSMEYLSGFSQNRITEYKFSTVALTRYIHYSALLPQSNSYPKKSGNYILKVYLDGDTAKTVFTKRMLVVDPKAVVSGRITQPTTPGLLQQYQKVSFRVSVNGINNFDVLRQMHVSLMKNFRWESAHTDIKPDFIRGSDLEFDSETTGVFPAGKEWRWLDIRDFHLQSDRVASADYNKNSTDIYLRPDRSLESQPYVFYPDLNGLSLIEAVRGINPNYEGDYARVYFSFYPPDGAKLVNQDIYLFGQLTNYEFDDRTRMSYNQATGMYETSLLLKQGYYDYTYLTKDLSGGPAGGVDGNYYETENIYTILIYYRPFGSRTDELIAVSLINSNSRRKGFGE